MALTLNIKNDVEFKFWAWLTSWTLLLTVKSWKEALLPAVPFKLTLVKFDAGWAVMQREIVTVTNVAANILTIIRASEACPKDNSATTHVATPYDFDEWDSAFMTLTAEMIQQIITDLNEKATKEEIAEWDLTYNATSTGNDSYQVSIPNANELKDGMKVLVKADVANTWACTLQVLWEWGADLWTASVKKEQWSTDLSDWDWKADWIACLIYNSTWPVWQFSSQVAVVAVPTVDINWLTEKTTPVNADEFIIYDNAWWVNKKVWLDNLKNVILPVEQNTFKYPVSFCNYPSNHIQEYNSVRWVSIQMDDIDASWGWTINVPDWFTSISSIKMWVNWTGWNFILDTFEVYRKREWSTWIQKDSDWSRTYALVWNTGNEIDEVNINSAWFNSISLTDWDIIDIYYTMNNSWTVSLMELFYLEITYS